VTVLPMPSPRELAAAMPSLLGDTAWRDRATRSHPLPRPAAAAAAALADAAIRALRARPGTPVHVARSYLMPLGAAVAERLGSAWATLDLDDDDQALASAAGNEDEAAAYGRLIGAFGPLFGGLAAAAPAEAAAITRRHGLTMTVIPNAVALPTRCPSAPGEAGRVGSVLFVGNLTYGPNADAAMRLVGDVLPRLRRLTESPVSVTLIGNHGGNPELLSLAGQPGVRLTGFVPDPVPYYREADVLVVPLAFGAGTRIKLLEAFAQGLPVVTTGQGARGLEVIDGVHALVADSAEAMAGAAAQLFGDAELRAQLAARAFDLVRECYGLEAVIPRIKRFFSAATDGAVLARA
jgi:glycosyltransferase involved in cell wall biosynthesis